MSLSDLGGSSDSLGSATSFAGDSLDDTGQMAY